MVLQKPIVMGLQIIWVVTLVKNSCTQRHRIDMVLAGAVRPKGFYIACRANA
jgi:hypothetical protein